MLFEVNRADLIFKPVMKLLTNMVSVAPLTFSDTKVTTRVYSDCQTLMLELEFPLSIVKTTMGEEINTHINWVRDSVLSDFLKAFPRQNKHSRSKCFDIICGNLNKTELTLSFETEQSKESYMIPFLEEPKNYNIPTSTARSLPLEAHLRIYDPKEILYLKKKITEQRRKDGKINIKDTILTITTKDDDDQNEDTIVLDFKSRIGGLLEATNTYLLSELDMFFKVITKDNSKLIEFLSFEMETGKPLRLRLRFNDGTELVFLQAPFSTDEDDYDEDEDEDEDEEDL